MKDSEILQLWKSYDQKLEQKLLFNRKTAEAITYLQIQSLLSSMKPFKVFTLLIGLLWVCFLYSTIIALYRVASPYFILSVACMAALNTVALGIYLYQLVLIQQVDVTKPILEAQRQIARLKSSTLTVTRLLFLQLPAWTTFYWSRQMFEEFSLGKIGIQVAVSLLFLSLAIWLFRNIRYENRHQKWFQLIFRGKEWNPLLQSMALLDEISEYPTVS